MADIQATKEAHWALYHEFETIALEIDKAPMMQKQAGIEKMMDLVSSTMVTHEKRINDYARRLADAETIIIALSKHVYGIPVEVEAEIV